MARHLLAAVTDDLVREVEALHFGPPVAFVYNPLVYARAAWDLYCTKWASAPRQFVLLGMNPGPFGMAQTGVPFGEVAHVRDWIGVEAPVGKPRHEHPKRPVQGFACPRSEVSGARLWGWAKQRFGAPERFFARFFVANHCPLVFMSESGANVTPDKLKAAEREPLLAACDRALRRTAEALQAKMVIGVGQFAENRARIACEGLEVAYGRVPHPSPASPTANRGWAAAAEGAFEEMGIKFGHE